jgi:uncharacterized protein YfaS (alpha-2-macroglobulin family)
MYEIVITEIYPTYDVTSLKVNGMAYPKLRVGTEVFIRAEVRDMSDEEKPLVDPENGIKITLRRPDGVAAVTDGVTIVEETGIYTYFHQTSSSDPTGVYRVSYSIDEDDGTDVRTIPQDAFELVP